MIGKRGRGKSQDEDLDDAAKGASDPKKKKKLDLNSSKASDIMMCSVLF